MNARYDPLDQPVFEALVLRDLGAPPIVFRGLKIKHSDWPAFTACATRLEREGLLADLPSRLAEALKRA